MNKAIATHALPADQLVIGISFVPKGKKRPVKVIGISNFYADTLDVYAESAQGFSAHVISRYDTVDFVVNDRSK